MQEGQRTDSLAREIFEQKKRGKKRITAIADASCHLAATANRKSSLPNPFFYFCRLTPIPELGQQISGHQRMSGEPLKSAPCERLFQRDEAKRITYLQEG
jgi:hypothetical protein